MASIFRGAVRPSPKPERVINTKPRHRWVQREQAPAKKADDDDDDSDSDRDVEAGTASDTCLSLFIFVYPYRPYVSGLCGCMIDRQVDRSRQAGRQACACTCVQM